MLIGDSPAMRAVHDQIQQVAKSNATVLLEGESGSGKELVARAIHAESLRAGAPIVTVNCGALPDGLIESELYGYERGAFTGALHRKRGRIELANGGTLFLDEVGELSLPAQVRFLRALQERTIERLGSEFSTPVDIRVIAATNRSLEDAVRDKQFRSDLYYRLNVFTIVLPPLRERGTDIPALADHFLARYRKEYRKTVSQVSADALRVLMRYEWPGNVRELQNVMERAVLVAKDAQVQPGDLPERILAEQTKQQDSSLSATAGAFEKNLLVEALRTARGSKTKSARLLGTSERVVRYKVRKYGINCSSFKHESR